MNKEQRKVLWRSVVTLAIITISLVVIKMIPFAEITLILTVIMGVGAVIAELFAAERRIDDKKTRSGKLDDEYIGDGLPPDDELDDPNAQEEQEEEPEAPEPPPPPRRRAPRKSPP